MKRFISYLYSIYNNQKIHNAGFARMELRTGRNRVDIHLKENGYAGKTGTVYLFIRKQENIQGISIGNITFRGNQADFRYEQAEENIGQTPWQIMQMNGILIMIEDRAAFLSQWDEQPVDTTRFEVWNIDKLKEKGVAEEQQKNQMDQKAAVQIQPGHIENKTDQRIRNMSPTATVAEQPEIEKGSVSAGSAVIHAEAGKELVSAAQPENENLSGSAIPKPTAQIQKENIPESEIQLKEGNVSTSAIPSEVRTASPAVQTGDSSTDNRYVVASSEQLESDGISSEEPQMNIRTAELQPQVRNVWNQTWRYMLRTYPVLNQFTDKNNVLCVRIEIKDIRLLPEKYWSMVNNSFLLHGFFNYRYLAFGRINQNWFLGIPGIYQNQEHVMASIFGFPDFLPQNQKDERGEQPGYWYRILEI